MRPKLTGVLETALYVDDVERAAHFYEKIFGFEKIAGDPSTPLRAGDRLWALSVEGRQVLLVCKRGASREPLSAATSHDAVGQQHLCFAIQAAELEAWEKWLAENGVAIIERRTWERGGRSLYFRDPDGHLLELATPGTWVIY